MNINLKLLPILGVCLISTACSTTSLNRDLVHQEKVKTVYINKLDSNVSIAKSNRGKIVGTVLGGVVGLPIGSAVDAKTNAKRKEGLNDLQEKINDFNVNVVIQNALEHNLLDSNAFSSEVLITSEFDSTVKKPYLIPVLTPSIVIAANYGSIDIKLNTSTSQKSESNSDKQNQHKGNYSSNQTIASSHLSKDKDINKQYWLDHPIELKEKVVNGLYDVTKQFADDFNSLEKSK